MQESGLMEWPEIKRADKKKTIIFLIKPTLSSNLFTIKQFCASYPSILLYFIRFLLICNHSIVDYKIDEIVVCFSACLPAYSLGAQVRRRSHSKRRCNAGAATAPTAMSAVAMTVELRASLARFHPVPGAVPPSCSTSVPPS